ncbi:caldesmon [Pelodytes ibericus]
MDDFERRRELRRQKREEMRQETERVTYQRNDDDEEEAARERRRRARLERQRLQKDDGGDGGEVNSQNSITVEETKSTTIANTDLNMDDEAALLDRLAKREERRQKRLKEAMERQKELDPTITDESLSLVKSNRNGQNEVQENDTLTKDLETVTHRARYEVEETEVVTVAHEENDQREEPQEEQVKEDKIDEKEDLQEEPAEETEVESHLEENQVEMTFQIKNVHYDSNVSKVEVDGVGHNIEISVRLKAEEGKEDNEKEQERLEAEERERVEAERRAAEERERIEEEARREAAERERVEAERKAAEEKERLEAESKREAEEKERLEAEAKREAEERENAEARERENAEARERERQEEEARKAAESERRAEEERKKAEQKRAEEERLEAEKRKAAEEKRKADEKKAAEERERKKAEDKKAAEEKARLEAKKKEEKLKAEDKKDKKADDKQVKEKKVQDEKLQPAFLKKQGEDKAAAKKEKDEKPRPGFKKEEVNEDKRGLKDEGKPAWDRKKTFPETKVQNGEGFHEATPQKLKQLTKFGGAKVAASTDEADSVSKVGAGKKLDDLRRRKGETESGEFEKLQHKQQEAAVELDELKKRREERKKIQEVEEQKKKQEEAERKVKEEEEKKRLKEEIEKRRAEAAEKRQKLPEEGLSEEKKPFKCFTPKGSSLKIEERAGFLNKSAQKSVKSTQPATVVVSKIDSRLEQYTSAIGSNKGVKAAKGAPSDLPLPADGVRNIKSMWEKGNVFSSPGNVVSPNKETAGLKVGVSSRINEWLTKTPETNKSPASKPSDLRPGDVSGKRNIWEKQQVEKPGSPTKVTTGGKKSDTNGLRFEKEP